MAPVISFGATVIVWLVSAADSANINMQCVYSLQMSPPFFGGSLLEVISSH